MSEIINPFETPLEAERKRYWKRCEVLKSREQIRVVDGEEIFTTECVICGTEVTYKTSDIPKFREQGRWNEKQFLLDACFLTSDCRDYYFDWKEHMWGKAGDTSSSKIYNPNKIARESKGLIL